MSKSSKPFGGDVQLFDSSFGWRFVNPQIHQMYGTDAMAVTAENLAELYQISREDQDLFAFRSQQKAFIAQQNGVLAEEIVKIEMADKKGNITIFDKDEFIKGNTTLQILGKLISVAVISLNIFRQNLKMFWELILKLLLGKNSKQQLPIIFQKIYCFLPLR